MLGLLFEELRSEKGNETTTISPFTNLSMPRFLPPLANLLQVTFQKPSKLVLNQKLHLFLGLLPKMTKRFPYPTLKVFLKSQVIHLFEY